MPVHDVAEVLRTKQTSGASPAWTRCGRQKAATTRRSRHPERRTSRKQERPRGRIRGFGDPTEKYETDIGAPSASVHVQLVGDDVRGCPHEFVIAGSKHEDVVRHLLLRRLVLDGGSIELEHGGTRTRNKPRCRTQYGKLPRERCRTTKKLEDRTSMNIRT